MERLLERVGVWWVLALVAVVVLAYSFWGATVLRAQHQSGAFSKTTGTMLTTTL